jgi:hypothetical protein
VQLQVNRICVTVKVTLALLGELQRRRKQLAGPTAAAGQVETQQWKQQSKKRGTRGLFGSEKKVTTHQGASWCSDSNLSSHDIACSF